MEYEFIVADGLSDKALNDLVNAAEAQITGYKQCIARSEMIRDMAKLKLLAKAIAEAEQE